MSKRRHGKVLKALKFLLSPIWLNIITEMIQIVAISNNTRNKKNNNNTTITLQIYIAVTLQLEQDISNVLSQTWESAEVPFVAYLVDYYNRNDTNTSNKQ